MGSSQSKMSSGDHGHAPGESKARKIIDDFGSLPLEATPLGTPTEATPETVLAMAIDAIIKSRPVTHDKSRQAVLTLINAGYHDIDKLAGSSWDDKAAVLKEGGYRYKEQASTNLGELAQFVEGYGTIPFLL